MYHTCMHAYQIPCLEIHHRLYINYLDPLSLNLRQNISRIQEKILSMDDSIMEWVKSGQTKS